ncbi:MAG TPA: TRAP transporter substrate-binding protein DctP [Firmicutes bacterium]|nr:TRAP transporter substrate-binding protein DctP [Bacillota bacterium]
MLRKRLVYIGFCLLLVSALALGGCGNNGNGDEGDNGNGAGSEEKVYELKYQLGHQRTQYLTQQAHIPFAERLEELSNGRLKLVLYDGGSITDDTLEGVARNLLQIAHGAPLNYPGQFPLSEITQLPFLVPSSTVGSMLTWHLSETFPEWRAEYPDDVIVLAHFSSATNQLHSKVPIRSLEDLQGKKVGVWNQIAVKVAENLGAIPVNDSGAESAMNLDRGLIDMVMCPLAPVRSFGVAEIGKYHTICNFFVDSFYVIACRSWVESLPEDLQEIILNNFGMEFAEACGLALDEGALIDSQWMLEEIDGTEIIVLDDAEAARWREKVMPIREEWLEGLEKKGMREVGEAMIAESEKFIEESVAAGAFVPDYTALK